MLQKNKLLRALLAAGLTTGMVACGGGGSSSDSTSGGDGGGGGGGDPQTSSQPTNTGQFVDSPVGGLEYTRSSNNGETYLTNDNGEFKYADNDTVTFKVGQLTIGSTKGAAVISPKNLAQGTGATNVARVLQTLDEDGDATNGITISSEVRSKAAKAATPRNISETADLDSIANEITDLSSDTNAQLVSATDADAHLNETLASISGADVTSCADEGAQELSTSDFSDLSVGMISDSEIMIMQFSGSGSFSEFKTKDNEYTEKDIKREGNWTFNENSQELSLTFPKEGSDGDTTDTFEICAVESKVITESDEGASYLYRLNKQIKAERAAGTYFLQYPDETGAIITLNKDKTLTYFEGESPTSASVSFGTGMATIEWAGESNDEIYFLSGQPTRTAIYLDFAETAGTFERIGTAKATAPITLETPTTGDLKGKAFLYRSDEADEVVVTELNDGTYVSYFNDSYHNDERQPAERRANNWSIANGVLNLEEETPNEERWRIALAKTTSYWGLKADENRDEINKIDSISLAKALTNDSFVGTYDIGIPTENNAEEVLTISEGGSCDYSGTGCNWSIDENGKGLITFGSGNDSVGNIWQMADRSNGYIFVMTHTQNEDDVEPGYMTRR
ncbi:hypothetical protein [Marinobacter sp.]|uniref:hypothetical protein n=1 Tax=Marinobacter sp. TaxID=50741 RepID=UPI002B269440|nr:hypothetical protein [Marinobacter sp.]